jgi:hypothetical protein
MHVEMRNSYIMLSAKFEGKIPLGRPKYKFEDSVEYKMDVKGL